MFTNTFRQLVIPLLFFNCLELFPRLLKASLEDMPHTLCVFAVDLGSSLWNGDPLVGPSWFILCLIWMRLLLWGMLKISEYISWEIAFTCVVVLINVVLALLGKQDAVRELCLSNAWIAFPFFSLGYIAKQEYLAIRSYYQRYKWVSLIAILAIWLLGVGYNGMVSIQSCTVGKNILWMYATGLSGSFVAIWLCGLFRKPNKMVYILSCGTIVILCTHGFMLNHTVNKYSLFEPYSLCWYLYAFSVSLVVLFIEIPIILFFFRYLRWSVGGRKLKI